MHPTKERLIQTVSAMLDADVQHDVILEDVLKTSGISRGSLYHHFSDFPDLVEQTLLVRFLHGVDETTQLTRDIANKAKTADEFWTGIGELIVYSQSPLRARRRQERTRIIGLAATSERLAKALAAEKERLTVEMTEIYAEVQANGWARNDLDPRTIAVFTQAYTLGRVVDDISEEHVNSGDWDKLLNIVLNTFKSDAK